MATQGALCFVFADSVDAGKAKDVLARKYDRPAVELIAHGTAFFNRVVVNLPQIKALQVRLWFLFFSYHNAAGLAWPKLGISFHWIAETIIFSRGLWPNLAFD